MKRADPFLGHHIDGPLQDEKANSMEYQQSTRYTGGAADALRLSTEHSNHDKEEKQKEKCI